MTLFVAAAAVVAAPLPAPAQTWPASVVSGAPRMAQAPANTLVRVERDPRLLRRQTLPPTEPRVKLRLSSADEVPEVDVRPKAEWFDDQGLRVSPTRVAFKQRF